MIFSSSSALTFLARERGDSFHSRLPHSVGGHPMGAAFEKFERPPSPPTYSAEHLSGLFWVTSAQNKIPAVFHEWTGPKGEGYWILQIWSKFLFGVESSDSPCAACGVFGGSIQAFPHPLPLLFSTPILVRFIMKFYYFIISILFSSRSRDPCSTLGLFGGYYSTRSSSIFWFRCSPQERFKST